MGGGILKWWIGTCTALVAGVCLSVMPVFAASTSSTLQITQLQIGNKSQPRFIEITNTAPDPVDVTDWCVYYHSSGQVVTTTTQRACLVSSEPPLYRVVVPAYKSISIASDYYGSERDGALDEGLGNGDKGLVWLMSPTDMVGDTVAWATTQNGAALSDFSPIEVQERGPHIFQRLKDNTGHYLLDGPIDQLFTEMTELADYEYGALMEMPDYCDNIDGIQSVVPAGYERFEAGDCHKIAYCANFPDHRIDETDSVDSDGNCHDVCRNIKGLQSVLPEGMVQDVQGNCVTDECLNLAGIQTALPKGFIKSSATTCRPPQPIRISEVLPNPAGTDAGKEFIELYNPNDAAVELGYHDLYFNDEDRAVSLPSKLQIAPQQYLAIYNATIVFTLRNTTGSVRLGLQDGSQSVTVPTWTDARDDMAWASLNGQWDYTNRPTPNAANLSSYVAESPSSSDKTSLGPCEPGKVRNPTTHRCRTVGQGSSTLQPCAADQYRSLETNRCRKKVTTATQLTPCRADQYRSSQTNRCRKKTAMTSQLVPCKSGQYRSPETNRCRSTTLASATKKPCAANQFRNPETGRCKLKNAAGSTLKPCAKNQVRNPDTNRCRKVSAALATTDFAVEPIKETGQAFVGWWTLGGVAAAAGGYGLWEWRDELRHGVGRLGRFFWPKK